MGTRFISAFMGGILFISGCSLLGQDPDIEYLSFESGANMAELSVLKVSPDYQQRILNLELADFEIEQDLQTGMVGGDFFDQFLEIASYYEDGDVKDIAALLEEGRLEGCSKDEIYFKVLFSGENKEEFDLSSCNDVGQDLLNRMSKFYTELTKLLSEDVQI